MMWRVSFCFSFTFLPFFYISFSLPFSVFVLLQVHIVDVIQFILQKLENPKLYSVLFFRIAYGYMTHQPVSESKDERMKTINEWLGVCECLCDLGIDSSEN